MSYKKIDKEFLITDDSVNVHGYRCLTSGFMLSEVLKNPIGFKMHNRNDGVVVRWDDFRIDKDRVFAKPVINLSHPKGNEIVNDITNGFLNGASVGKIVVIESTNDIKLMLPKQTKETVTKWFPREISLVDIPGNYNALAKLYDINNNNLNLMDLLDNNSTSEIDSILEQGIKDGKIIEKTAKELKKNYSDKPKELKSLLDSLPLLRLPKNLEGKKWDDLYKMDLLEQIRNDLPEYYEKLKKEKYNK